MKKILYINGNPQQESKSFSRQTAKYYLSQLNSSEPETEIIEFNVNDEYIPFIDEDVLNAWSVLGSGKSFDELSDSQVSKISRMGEILELFKTVDEYVVSSPLWNFSVTPKLKAFIDNVAIAGETFKYTEAGPVGLLTDKKVTFIQSSGGFYTDGPAAAMEHGINYLETVFSFMGIEVKNKIYVEGIAMPDKSFEEKLQNGFKQVDDLVASNSI